MAKKQVATVEVFCNAKQAVQVLNEYKRLASDTLSKIEQKTQRVNAIRAKGTNATKAELAEMKKLTAELKKDEANFRMYNSAVQKGIDSHVKLRNVMRDLSGSKLKDLKYAMRELQKMMQNVSNDTPKRAQVIQNSIQKVQAQITKLTGETGKFGAKHSSVWQTAVRNITAYVGVFGAFNFLKSKLTEIIKLNNQLSDQMADIRKVSGLAMEDIRQLTTNLSKMDTRTTLEELNRIAYAGAKLGFGNEGIEGLEQFTRAANQVNVALKEDLGDEALTALSKITENMGLIKKMGVENAMLATGSAMFKLASTSTAAAGPIVEVTKRIVPMAQQAGLATDEILALASSADSLQLMPEVVGTAISKLIGALQTNHNLVEKSFDLPAGTVENWMKQGRAMDLILTIFDKMKEKGNMSALGDDFKKLGGEGFRLISVLTAMANHVDTVRTHLATSRQAFREATAVTEEYNIQQETAAALIERANNAWRNAFVNPEQSETIKGLAQSWYDFTKNLLSSDAAMTSIKFGIESLIFALKTLINMIPGLMAFGLVKMFQSLTSALGLTTIATNGLAASWAKMTAAMKANWIGLLAAAIAQVVYWIHSWISANSEAEEKQISVNKAVQEAKEKAEQEINTLSRLKAQIDNTNLSQEERNNLLSKVRADYDIYLNYLGIEIKTVDDLARHYDALTKVMKQRFAYQEREEYKKTLMAGDDGSRMKRRLAGSELIKTLQENGVNIRPDVLDIVRTAIVKQNTAIDNFNDKYGGVYNTFGAKQRREIKAPGITFDAFINMLGANVNASTRRAANKFISSVISEANEERDIDAAFAAEIGDFDYDKYLRTQVKGDFTLKPDKEAIKAAKAAAREEKRRQKEMDRQRKKELQDQLKEAEQESDAIIAKIEEWYRLQETFIEDAVADNKLTRDYADAYLRTLKMSKNQTLANARKSIAGKMNKEDWDKFIGPELERMMADQGAWSTELAGDIMKANLQAIYNLLARFNGSPEVMGLKSTASFDRIMKNAAGNEREIARERAKIKEEVDKILLEYHYVEQAERGFHSDLVSLGIMAETYEQYVNRMREEAKKAGIPQQQGEEGDFAWNLSLPSVGITGKRPATPEEQLLKQFLSNGAKPYGVNIENDRELFVWLKNLMSNYDYDEEDNIMFSEADWVKGFPQLKQWVEDIDKYKPDIQKFYLSLIKWEDEYYNAKKKAYERDKKLQEDRFRASGESEQFEREQKALETQKKWRTITGTEANFGQQYGLEDAIAEDPEIARIKLRMEWRAKELKDAQERGAAQELINQRQTELLEEFSNLATAVSTEIASRMAKIKELSEPAATFAEEIGMKMGDAIFNMESQSKNWNEIIKSMILSYSTMTIKMIAENLTKKLQMELFYKQMEAGEIAHQTTMLGIQQAFGAMRVAGEAATGTEVLATKTAMDSAEVSEEVSMATISTSLGISKGAAKIIGSLGWWGIPLIAVISSLLIGLLTSALSTAGKKSNASSTNVPKTKLVSGMLTYDEGNVQSYVGNDGHVYRASRQTVPQGTSLITSPIATTINGNPALVAERGPEIVIGRRTTRQIMMNEPGLLQHLAQLDRRHSVPRYRTYDDGNLSSYVALPTQPQSEAQAERDEQMRQTLDALTRTVVILHQRLQQPIKAEINKYGTGGLIDEVKSGLKFDQRYNR